MKNLHHDRQSELKRALRERMSQRASRGQYRRALEMLDRGIEDPLPSSRARIGPSRTRTNR